MRKTQSALSMLGVAAAGAAAMYLLDPKAGAERRRRLGARAGGAMASAEEVLGEGWESLSARASDLAAKAAKFGSDAMKSTADCVADFQARASDNGGEAASGVGNYAERVAREAAEYAQHLSDQAKAVGAEWAGDTQKIWKGLGSKIVGRIRGASQSAYAGAGQVSDQAQSLAEEARDWARRARETSASLLHRAGDAVGGEEDDEHSLIAPIALAAVTCGVIGLGAVYFLHPEHGEARRAMVLEKSNQVIGQTGDLARRVGRQVRDRLVGLTGHQWDDPNRESFSDPADVGLAGTSSGTADQIRQAR